MLTALGAAAGFRRFLCGGLLRLGSFLFDYGRCLLHRFDLYVGPDDREERVGAGAFGQGEQGSGDLVDGVVLDDAAAVQAGHGSAAGVEKAEVVVDLSRRRDGGAGIAGLVLLLDGDGRGEAVHEIDVRLFDALQKLAGVSGERFDVTALALGVYGIEGERRFAGTADAADDGKRVVGNIDVDALEIMGACAANCDLVIHKSQGLGSRD